jgi:hypothetical protein
MWGLLTGGTRVGTIGVDHTAVRRIAHSDAQEVLVCSGGIVPIFICKSS